MLKNYFKSKFGSKKEASPPPFTTPFFHSNGKTNITFSYLEPKFTNSGLSVLNKVNVNLFSNRISKLQLNDMNCLRVYDDAGKQFIQLQYVDNALIDASYFMHKNTLSHDDLLNGPLNDTKMFNYAFLFDEDEYLRDIDTENNEPIHSCNEKEITHKNEVNNLKYMIYYKNIESEFGNEFLYFEETPTSYNLYKMNEVDLLNIKFFGGE